MNAEKAYAILPKYIQLRVDHERKWHESYSCRMQPLTIFAIICEGGRLPRGFYNQHGKTSLEVSKILASDFNRKTF